MLPTTRFLSSTTAHDSVKLYLLHSFFFLLHTLILTFLHVRSSSNVILSVFASSNQIKKARQCDFVIFDFRSSETSKLPNLETASKGTTQQNKTTEKIFFFFCLKDKIIVFFKSVVSFVCHCSTIK